MTDPTDDLAGVLRPADATPDPARREAVLRRTVGVLRHLVLYRRWLVLAGAVALFAGGCVVGWVAKPTPVVVVVSPPEVAPPDTPAVIRRADPKPLTASELELEAELADDPSDAARLFREAGDSFLTDRDYDNAARCYRRHLNAADADARKASADDSWLLMSLKTPAR